MPIPSFDELQPRIEELHAGLFEHIGQKVDKALANTAFRQSIEKTVTAELWAYISAAVKDTLVIWREAPYALVEIPLMDIAMRVWEHAGEKTKQYLQNTMIVCQVIERLFVESGYAEDIDHVGPALVPVLHLNLDFGQFLDDEDDAGTDPAPAGDTVPAGDDAPAGDAVPADDAAPAGDGAP